MIPQNQSVVKSKSQGPKMSLAEAENIKDPYFYNYLFPHNEKRCYKNKLNLGLDNVIYLGPTLKDGTNRHWRVNPTIPIEVSVKRVLRLGKLYYQYDFNGQTEYASSLLDIKKAVGKATINIVDETKTKPIKKPTPELSSTERAKVVKQKISQYEMLRQQFDKLPESDKFCCYCEVLLDRMSVTRDHIIPKSKGGKGVNYGHENIRPCCSKCNSEKGSLWLREYIGKLNAKFVKQTPNTAVYQELQRKIINANKIAKEIATFE